MDIPAVHRASLLTDSWKRAAAVAAVGEIEDGMTVGLGTGTTAAFAIDALAGRMGEGLICRAVATSQQTAERARTAGIPLIDLTYIAAIDLCIDGVDEIDPGLRGIKGAGGAMLREKIVATAACRMIAIADASKAVSALGGRPVPVELLPLAHGFVTRQVGLLGGDAILRRNSAGVPAQTDQDNWICDCRFAAIDDAAALAANLSAIPGILEHGLFLSEIGALYLGTADGVLRTERPR
jgi:ribose 5-phosphate isomerase A